MATKEEVRQRVGEDLGLVPIGQDLENQDQARIDATGDEVYAMLQEKGLAAWDPAGEIPTRMVTDFALLMTQKLTNSYSVPDARLQRITANAGPNGELALLRLAAMINQEYESIDNNLDF